MIYKEEQAQHVSNMDERIVTIEEIEEIKEFDCVKKVQFVKNVREQVKRDVVGNEGERKDLAAWYVVVLHPETGEETEVSPYTAREEI